MDESNVSVIIYGQALNPGICVFACSKPHYYELKKPFSSRDNPETSLNRRDRKLQFRRPMRKSFKKKCKKLQIFGYGVLVTTDREFQTSQHHT